MFSKACEHGIRAVLYIATQSMDGRRVKIGEVAEHADSPEAFTAKVMGTLSRFKIIDSLKGPYGGFTISEEKMQKVKLIDVVKAIDGDALFTGCALGMKECNSNRPCPAHYQFVNIRSELIKMLESNTIHELALGVKAGKSVLIR